MDILFQKTNLQQLSRIRFHQVKAPPAFAARYCDLLPVRKGFTYRPHYRLINLVTFWPDCRTDYRKYALGAGSEFYVHSGHSLIDDFPD